MSKTLVTALGLVVSLGIIALGVFLIAMPLYFQSTSTDAATATVASTNADYQAQVDSLRDQEENLPEINASVQGLRAQIPATGQLDDVFEVIARAAESAGVTIGSVTAGEQVGFASADTGAAAAPATGDGTAVEPVAPAPNGRQQVDFAIQVTATDMGQATAFLDALRAGPRLLSSIESIATQTGEGAIGLQVSALTYLDSEG